MVYRASPIKDSTNAKGTCLTMEKKNTSPHTWNQLSQKASKSNSELINYDQSTKEDSS